MNIYFNILKDLICFSEITVDSNSDCWINKYGYKKTQKIDTLIFDELIYLSVIFEDSGNFETGETHYIINSDYYSMKKLQIIDSLLNSINNRYSLYIYEIKNALELLKKIETRKLKFIKIYENR